MYKSPIFHSRSSNFKNSTVLSTLWFCCVFIEYAKLLTSATAVEVISPAGHLSPAGVLMPAAAAGGGSLVVTLDQQPAKDVGHLTLPLAGQSTSPSALPQQISSVLSSPINQLVLCPTPTVPSQFTGQSAPLTIAAAGSTSLPNSAAQFCTVLAPMTSVPLLQVPTLVMPAAVGVPVPVSPVFVAGNVSGTSSLFMVPN